MKMEMVFDKIDFGFWCNSKQMIVDTWHIHWMCILAFYLHHKIFKNILPNNIKNHENVQIILN